MARVLLCRLFPLTVACARVLPVVLAGALGSFSSAADAPPPNAGSLSGLVAFAAKGEVLERARITIEEIGRAHV
jgi:hypothetical protein